MSEITRTAVENSPAAIADLNFSQAADVLAWQNLRNDDIVTLALGYTIALAGDSGGIINVYFQALEIGRGESGDGPIPSSAFKKNWIGTFSYKATETGTLYDSIEVGLPKTNDKQKYKFFLENKLGVQIDDFELDVCTGYKYR